MNPTNLSLPPELEAALSTIATNGQDQPDTPQPDLVQSAIEWQKSRLRTSIPKQVMDYEQARAIFDGYWKNHLVQGETFAVLPSNEAHVANIVKWLIFDSTSEIPLHKSVWLYGLVGSGKSILAKTIHDFVDYLHEFVSSKINWNYCDLNSLIPRAKFDASVLEVLNVKKSIIIDEIREQHSHVPLPYGVVFKLADLIASLYSLFQEKGIRVLVTSNLPPEKSELFDDRTFDRMLEMYRSIHWHGGSLRKSK